MTRHQFFIVSVFLVFILSISGMLYGQRVIDLDKVWGDIRVLGDDVDGSSGQAVAYGDINGDGYMDIIIGAPYADPGERSFAGETYVIFGSSSPPSTIDLSKESADITVCGAAAEDLSGRSVASGDVNNDGFDDIIIGARYADPGERSYAGETYVIFGSSFASPTTIDLSTESADITVCGADSGDHSGCAVASGDVNADGYDDIIIGAPGADPGDPPRYLAGETYVIFGKIFSSPATIDLSSTPADITVCGADALDYSGWAVASGDVNGDGFDDIIIGAYGADPGDPPRDLAGETYVIFGSISPPSTIDLSKESADITVCGAVAEDMSGYAVTSGDVNGDGFDDIIIGAPVADPGERSYAGETYVIFGSSSPPSTIDLSKESADITVCGADALDYSGWAVASGDVNGDGYDDLIIGAPWADPGEPARTNAGETYVIFGSISPPSTIDLSTESADITVCGADALDYSGWAVASGDVNGDGFDDIIIGAPDADPGEPARDAAGETYLIAGGGAFITAHGLGGTSRINSFSLLGRSWGGFKAFGGANSGGEVHLAIDDLDGDGHHEIAAGQGEDGKSWVKLFEVNGSLIRTFKAFGAVNVNGELHLALGNFDADTSDNEIAAAQGEGGQSWVKLFKAEGTFIRIFKAFGAANTQGEVHLAAADLDNNGVDEIMAATGEGGSSWVKIFSHEGILIRSFKAFGGANNGGEVHVAVGNFDADADLEIAAATGYDGNNRVKLFNKDGSFIRQFTAFGFGGNPNGEVQIAAADIDNDGTCEIICAHGEGGGSWVKVFKADGTAIRSFKAFGVVNAQGEVHIGRSNY